MKERNFHFHQATQSLLRHSETNSSKTPSPSEADYKYNRKEIPSVQSPEGFFFK